MRMRSTPAWRWWAAAIELAAETTADDQGVNFVVEGRAGEVGFDVGVVDVVAEIAGDLDELGDAVWA